MKFRPQIAQYFFIFSTHNFDLHRLPRRGPAHLDDNPRAFTREPAHVRVLDFSGIARSSKFQSENG